jgi:hypothetical protein
VVAYEHLANALRNLGSQFTQLLIEHDGYSTAHLTVEQSAFGDSRVEHLLQTHGLSAQLRFVCPVCLRLASLVFDWVRPFHLSNPMELDRVSFARNTQMPRPQRYSLHEPHAPSSIRFGLVDTRVE